MNALQIKRVTVVFMGLACILLFAACSEDPAPPESPPGDGTGDGVTDDVTVSDPAARSCELVILDPDETVTDVQFDDSVIGRHMRRGSRLAVAFFQQEDVPIRAGAVTLSSTSSDDSVDFEIVTTNCYDRLGALLEDVTLSLGD